MMTLLALAAAATDTAPWGWGSNLLTWTGVVAVLLGLLLWGLLIPKSSHLREIRILKEGHAREVAAYQLQLADKDAQILAWRGVGDIERLGKQEATAQLRISLETNQSFARDFSDFRSGVERAQKKAQDER